MFNFATQKELDRLIEIYSLKTGVAHELVISREGDQITDYSIKGNGEFTPLNDNLHGAIFAMETLIGIDPNQALAIRIKLVRVAMPLSKNARSVYDLQMVARFNHPIEGHGFYITIEFSFKFGGNEYQTFYVLLANLFEDWSEDFIAGLLYSQISYAIANKEYKK